MANEWVTHMVMAALKVAEMTSRDASFHFIAAEAGAASIDV